MQAATRAHGSIDSRMLSRIRGLGRGALFAPANFLDLGSRLAVDVALHRMVKKGLIRRLGRGLYDFPKTDPALGPLSPSIDAIAKALASKDHLRLQPSGAYAANLLRLSDQVPARIIFLTDGPSRKIRVGRQEIILKRTTPRNMAAAGRTTGLLIQALRYLGREHVSTDRIAHLRGLLPAKERKQILEDLPLAPAWMHPFLRAIAGDKERKT